MSYQKLKIGLNMYSLILKSEKEKAALKIKEKYLKKY
jgi:hypothetical protein